MIAHAEQLKQELTDKYVVVKEGIAELRRFVGLTGRVKTVNMNCRALVQFDSPVDISWYDIDPGALVVVDAPLPKKATEHKAGATEKTEQKAPAKAAGGKSPLEMARQQGAKKEGAAETAKKLSPLEMARQQGAASAGGATAEATGKKLSPLELARQQGAAGAAKAPAKPAAEKPASGKALSPLELARQQGAAGSGGATAAEAAPTAQPETIPAAPAVEAAATPKATTATPTSTAEIIALARQQGAFKG